MSTRDTGASTRGSRPRRMGRPPMADREAIIAAALGIGFARLTMPAVAERLGISHSTLYRYFPSRDALAAAAADHAVDAIEWPEPEDDWRAFLTATAWAHGRDLRRRREHRRRGHHGRLRDGVPGRCRAVAAGGPDRRRHGPVEVRRHRVGAGRGGTGRGGGRMATSGETSPGGPAGPRRRRPTGAVRRSTEPARLV
ncbi:helix-turn-helix domain-containing protein [Streptomyces anulatus]